MAIAIARKNLPAALQRPAAPASGAAARFWNEPWFLGLASGVLFWAALPPLNAWPLGWVAVSPLVLLTRQDALPGRRPYWMLYGVGVLFWLVTVYWLTLPHWATAFGWLAISIYMGVYWPLTVGLVRVAHWRLGISPVIAAPVVWTGCELARAHIFTGFLMAALGHTQLRRLPIIQISDLGGAYTVSFLLALVGAGLASVVPWAGRRGRLWPLAPVVLAPLAAWGYGAMRLGEARDAVETKPSPTVALIQGSVDTELKSDPAKGREVFSQYYALTLQARAAAERDHLTLDLIVWPETMFRDPLFRFDDDYQPPADADWTVAEARRANERMLSSLSQMLGAPTLLGIVTLNHTAARVERFNSALFLGDGGQTPARYDKCYLVMFGEYVPLAERFPFLYHFTPLPGSLDAGAGAVSAEIHGVRYAPNICYETTSPHLIRAHVNQLRARNEEPDVLVNLTNDGWFWGSTELDMHLACGAFRAIETRKPLLVAANTGFSAWIESTGEIRARGQRRAEDFLIARPKITRRGSFYLDHGDWLSGACLACCLGLGAVGLRDRWLSRGAA